MKQDATKQMDIVSIAECAYRWARATEVEINRVRANAYSQEYENQVIRIADDHFLKISLHHLLSWLKQLEKFVSYSKYTEIEDELFCTVSLEKGLAEACPNLHDYRNMLEHDIEYYEGNGRSKINFIDEKYQQSKLQPLITQDGDYLIAGEISLNKIEPIVHEIVEVTKTKQFNIKSNVFEMTEEELRQLFDNQNIL